MKLIIDIPEDIRNKIIEIYNSCEELHTRGNLYQAIASGKPYEVRPTGKWEEIKSSCDIGHRFYHCSVCNRFLDVMTADGETLEDYPFCHCGADMRKQSEGDDNGKA